MKPTDDELEAMAARLEAMPRPSMLDTLKFCPHEAAAMLRACKGRVEPEEHCEKCGAPKSNHPYRHPFVSMTLKKGPPQ